MVLVLPAPAPAKIRTGPVLASTALLCSVLSFSREFCVTSVTISHACLALRVVENLIAWLFESGIINKIDRKYAVIWLY